LLLASPLTASPPDELLGKPGIRKRASLTVSRKPKAKAAVKKTMAAKTAPKKTTQTKLTTGKAAPKKRAKPESDDEDNLSISDLSNLSNTPPSSKKQKKAPASKKSGGKPLAEIANDSFTYDAPADGKPKSKKTATETYQKLTQLEHILKRPDTYIGSVERSEQKQWVYNKTTQEMENRQISFVPGLYKIVDEILVNAADNKQRDKTMSYIKVTIDRDAGEISVQNDGKGIPVEMHQTEKIYIPEMVFGHLLAGSNFDDNEKKTVGGRNGYGAKLCNVFSTHFAIETQDSANGKRYKQSWSDNMSKMEKAKITANKSADFVKVSFKPDFSKFGMPDGFDDDFEALIYRRVYDLAGTVQGIKVHLNGEVLKGGFSKYCAMYSKAIARERGEDTSGELPQIAKVIIEDEKAKKRWAVGFTVSDGSFQQVSFVNSIATTTGGTHVNYIADQICQALLLDLNKKKKGHSLKTNHIRNHIFIFVDCLIDNPAFTSQTKEQLTTKVSAFGSKFQLSDGFIKKIKQTEAITNIIHFAERKADKMMSKSDGNKRSRISNEKLVDANLAGTKHGHECTLILTEGDSARGLAVAGRAVLDPDRIGVFPLRGKMLNVRDASIDQITKNKEIQNIKQFLGLKHKQVYTNTKDLRYGHLMIMADQDHDGSHIKGLLINFLQVQFPSLLQIPDFFREFITPVVKVWQGPNPKKPLRLKSFFTIPQYEEWKALHMHEMQKWHSKYYKGLGTSSNEDAQVYFTNLDEHLKEFDVMKPEETELFELAFSKKKADARKEWLGAFTQGTFLDHTTKSITYSDFVNKELILFSMADNIRSIPSVIDGLKPGQRKVIYACFKRNLTKDKKVVELAGYVSEQTAYHHGEQSLQQTIVGLAQTFVGSNNVNCLEPSGNFGSRLAGGSDAASARYIHTRLSPFARRVFPALDEPNLEHQFEDGKTIEPKVFAPIIPMVLVNGADGIGTGWSTSIPNYHPVDIVKNLKRRMGRLDGESEELPFEPMTPWFRGWKGIAEPEAAGRFKFNGLVSHDASHPNEVVITELPIRMWTDDFKARLEEIIRAEKSPSFIKDYQEFNDHKNVHFVIQMEEKHMNKALEEGLLEKFKLQKSVATTNLVAFDTNGQIRKYEKVEDIMEEFYGYRMKMYSDRKAYWLKVYHADYRRLKNQYRFIEEIIDGKLVVSRKKKTILIEELRTRKYEAFPKNAGPKKAKSAEEEMEEEDAEGGVDGEAEEKDAGTRDYDYLLSVRIPHLSSLCHDSLLTGCPVPQMPIWSLTVERLAKLKTQIAAKKAEHDELDALSEKDLWCKDLDDFIEEWDVQLRLDAEIQTNIRRMGRRVSKKIGAGTGRRIRDDDDYVDKKPKKTAVPKISRVETKAHERFAEMFSGKPKPQIKSKPNLFGYDGAADESDDDFALLGKPKTSVAKPAPATKVPPKEEDQDEHFDEEPAPEPEPAANTRVKRAAATKTKTWLIDDDEDENESSDDDKMLGDVGAMVKGIGGSNAPATSNGAGRLSLFAMSQGPSSGSGALSRLKTKPSRNFADLDNDDDTNYEMLARSPQKATKTEDVDAYLSDDDGLPLPSKVTSAATKASSAAVVASSKASLGAAAAKKPRGRPAGAKNKSKDVDEPIPSKSTAAKPVHLSPAAKAYAAKKVKDARVKKDAFAFSDDEPAAADDDDDDVVMREASPAPVKARGRPGRAATAKSKPKYIDSDEDDSMAVDGKGDDDFDMNDDDEY
jgi:DNA topoisomerase II